MQPVPKRILHVSETPLGGVTSCLQELVRSQVTLDVDTVEVITPEVNLPEFSGPDFDGPEGNKLRLTPFRHSRGSVQTLVRQGILGKCRHPLRGLQLRTGLVGTHSGREHQVATKDSAAHGDRVTDSADK